MRAAAMQAPFDPYRRWLGIPPSEQPPNLYRLLGLSHFESDPDVIATAADARMVHLKTFERGSNSEWSQKLLNEVSAAQLCLLDPRRKAEYDRKLRRQLDDRLPRIPQPPPLPPPAGPPPAPPEPPPKLPVVFDTAIGPVDASSAADYVSARRRSGRWARAAVLVLLLGLVAAAAYYRFRFRGPHTPDVAPPPPPAAPAPVEPADDEPDLEAGTDATPALSVPSGAAGGRIGREHARAATSAAAAFFFPAGRFSRITKAIAERGTRFQRTKQENTDLSGELHRSSRQQIITQHSIARMQQGLATMQWALQKDKADPGQVERQIKSLQSQSNNKGRR